MNEKEDDGILAFDTLFTANHIQIMKILLPYFDKGMQKHLAVYIKYLELCYTIDYFKSYPGSLSGQAAGKKELDLAELYPKLQGYLTPSQQKQAEQLLNMMQTFKTFREMKDMMDMMNSFQGGEGPDGGDPADFLKNMLTPEQMAMFEMFRDT